MAVNNINKWIFLAFLCGMIVITACTDPFVGYNTNQHQATEEMMSYNDLKVGAFFTQMQKNVVMFDEKAGDNGNLSSDYQVAQGLTADIFSGYFAPTLGNGALNNGSYYFVTSWIEQTFTKSMKNVMGPWLHISKESEKQQRPYAAALATIVKIEAMHRVADTYGPIPYINFDGSLQNQYDALDLIYKRFLEELDSSIDILTSYYAANSSSAIFARYDVVYGGDVLKWIKFANTLRLRLAMRIVYANGELARQEAEKSASHQLGLVSTSNDRAVLTRSTNLAYYHPLYDIAYNFGKGSDAYHYGDCQPGATMDSYMNGYADPRLDTYLTRATDDGEFHGVRCGIPTTAWDKYRDHRRISGLKVDQSSTEIVWMNASESYFLLAEGALRGWNMGGTAQSFYERGIRASFEENGVSGVDAYIANTTSIPIDFVDNSGSKPYYNIASPSNITIAWRSGATMEENLERIITQKWIALYPNGPEAWAEFRRTGYPKLFPVITNSSGGTINTNVQVRRCPYPQSEYNNNREGVQSALLKLGGADNGGVKLWWDKK